MRAALPIKVARRYLNFATGSTSAAKGSFRQDKMPLSCPALRAVLLREAARVPLIYYCEVYCVTVGMAIASLAQYGRMCFVLNVDRVFSF